MKLKLWVSWSENREIILDYLGGPHVITGVLQSGGGRWDGRGDWSDNSVKTQLFIAGFEGERGAQAKECGQPLEAKKSKKTDSPLVALQKKL